MTPYGRMCSAEVNNDRWALSCTEGEQVPPLTSLTVGARRTSLFDRGERLCH